LAERPELAAAGNARGLEEARAGNAPAPAVWIEGVNKLELRAFFVV
jgi:hypothetical protein